MLRYRQVLLNANPQRDENEQITGVVGVGQVRPQHTPLPRASTSGSTGHTC
jgi:hypothetical protein